MNNQSPPTTSINVVFAIDGMVRAQASIVLPYFAPLNMGDTVVIGCEFANVDTIQFTPHRHRLFVFCSWVYDPTEVENLADALKDAAAEGWTIECS